MVIAAYSAHTAIRRVRPFSWINPVVKFMKSGNRLIKIGVIGGVFTALCCFTPILIWMFALLGISALVGYLDYVLFPMLAIFLVFLVIGLVQRWRGK
ncbi:MAG: mercury resistance system transport protein MerF [Marinobacter sp.]|uniref:mercury resistance system transport protein MerF n=1 Tax=Marinobacter sp. TaxID=50741 RepID=UPI003299AC8B